MTGPYQQYQDISYGNYVIGPDGLPLVGQPRPLTPATSAYQPLSGAFGQPLLPPSLSGSMSMSPLAGLDPLISSPQVAASIAQQQALSTSMLLSQLKILSGDIERQFKAIADHVKGMGQSVGTTPMMQRPGAPVPRPERPVPSDERVHPHEQPEPDQGEELPPVRGLTFGEARDSTSMTSIRRRAASGAARRLQSRVGRYELRDQFAVDSGGEVSQQARWVDEEGRVLGRFGQVGATVGTNAMSAASKIARGESVSSALPGFGRVAGPVGFTLGVGAMAVHQLASQREMNRGYQAIYGGPNFSLTDPRSGFRGRLAENVFGWGQVATMGSSRARELYRGVSEIGLTGDSRHEALQFATGEFNRLGMDPQQALQLINQMVTNGVSAFTVLSSALDKVSETARSAGMNVSQAQQRFGQVLGAVQQSVTGTEAAPVIAAGIQNELTKQGQTLSGQLDFTGMLGQQSLMMQATRLGMNPTSYIAKAGQDPALLGKGLQANVDQIRDAAFSAQALSWAHDQAAREMQKTGGTLTPAAAARIGREMAERGMFNPMQFMAVAGQLGLGGVTPANVYEVAAKIAVGAFRFDQALAQNDLPDKGTTIDGQKIQTGTNYDPNDPNLRSASLLDPGAHDRATGAERQAQQLKDAIGQRGKSPTTADMSYFNAVIGEHGTGQRSSILEALLKDERGLQDKHFVVDTKDGPREVPFDEAFKLYQDQLRSGNVRIRETGETVADVTGKVGDTSVDTPSAGQPAPGGAKPPEQQTSGTVTIYPTAELQRILRFSSTGGIYIDSAQRAGIPASPFPSTPSDYPSSTGGR